MCIISRSNVFNQGTAWSCSKLKQDWVYLLLECLKCQSTGMSLKVSQPIKPHLSDLERDDLELTEMPLIFDFHISLQFALHNTDAQLSSQLSRHPL